jgi:hypothetical protein
LFATYLACCKRGRKPGGSADRPGVIGFVRATRPLAAWGRWPAGYAGDRS